jgi:hypothetical protein
MKAGRVKMAGLWGLGTWDVDLERCIRSVRSDLYIFVPL